MPRVRDVKRAADPVDVSTHSITVPDVKAGDLLVWIVVKDATAGTNPATPTGWTKYYSRSNKYAEFAIFYKRADGSEAGTTVSTSSSDADSWVSVMFSLIGASDPDPVSTLVEYTGASAVNDDTFPAQTLPGNNRMAVWFFWTGGVGGATIGPGGVRMVADEGTSVALIVHVDQFYSETQTYPMGLQATSAQTFVGGVFFIPDDGTGWDERVNHGWITRVVNTMHYDDGFIDNASTDIYTLPVSTVAGHTATPSVATSTNYQADAAIYPIQYGWKFRVNKGTDWRGTYGALSRISQPVANIPDGTFLLYNFYPYTPKYYLLLSTVEFGAGFGLMDTSNRLAFWPTNGSDDVTGLRAGFLSLLLDPYYQAGALQYDAGFDPTNIDKFIFLGHAASGNPQLIVSRMYIVTVPEIVGGSSSHPSNLDTLVKWFSGTYTIPYRLIGSTYELRVPIAIGDGSTPTYFKAESASIQFPRSGSLSAKDVTHQVRPGKMGIHIQLGASDTAVFDKVSISCPSGFYLTSNGQGSATFSNCSFFNPTVFEAKSGVSVSGSSFYSPKNIHIYSGSSFSSNSVFGTFDNSPAIVLHDVSTLSSTSIDSAYIGVELTDPTITTYTFDACTFSNNTYDVKNSSGQPITIRLLGGSNASTYDPSGSPVTFQSLVTVTLDGIADGSDVDVYLGTLANSASATLIASASNVTGGSWSFTHSNPGQQAYIVVQHLNYRYLAIELALPSVDSTIPISQQEDRVYSNP